MLPERDLEIAVGRWLATAPTLSAPSELHDDSMASLRGRRQRPRILAQVRPGSWPTARPVLRFVASAAVVVALLAAGALLAVWVGARLEADDLRQRELSTHPLPFTYAIPPDSGLAPDRPFDAWVVGWSAGGSKEDRAARSASEPWGPNPAAEHGVMIGVGPVWGHSIEGRFVLRRDPAGFLEDLRDRARVAMGPIEAATVSGIPALAADIDQLQTDLHPGTNTAGLAGKGYVADFPSRLIVTVVDEHPVFIQIWARNAKALEAWLPTAQQFVDSIRFADASS
jgi:hypothetical protein